MKRTVWSLLVSAAAAVFPAVHGVHLPALAPEAAVPAAAPEPVKLPEAPRTEIVRSAHDLDDAPAPALLATVSATPILRAPAGTAVVAISPDSVPLSRRSLGKPRARAPDALV